MADQSNNAEVLLKLYKMLKKNLPLSSTYISFQTIESHDHDHYISVQTEEEKLLTEMRLATCSHTMLMNS